VVLSSSPSPPYALADRFEVGESGEEWLMETEQASPVDPRSGQESRSAETTQPYRSPSIVELGTAAKLVRSMSYGGYLDGDSNPDFRHKPA
jgi:hypothetical protein